MCFDCSSRAEFRVDFSPLNPTTYNQVPVNYRSGSGVLLSRLALAIRPHLLSHTERLQLQTDETSGSQTPFSHMSEGVCVKPLPFERRNAPVCFQRQIPGSLQRAEADRQCASAETELWWTADESSLSWALSTASEPARSCFAKWPSGPLRPGLKPQGGLLGSSRVRLVPS